MGRTDFGGRRHDAEDLEHDKLPLRAPCVPCVLRPRSQAVRAHARGTHSHALAPLRFEIFRAVTSSAQCALTTCVSGTEYVRTAHLLHTAHALVPKLAQNKYGVSGQ